MAKNLVESDVLAERAWDRFRTRRLKQQPSKDLQEFIDELRRRWFRYRFTQFVSRELKQINEIPMKPIGDEETVFRIYPQLKREWNKEKRNSDIVLPTDALLYERWLKKRKLEFKKNWLKQHKPLAKDEFKYSKIIYGVIETICNSRVNVKYWGLRIISVLPLVLVILLAKGLLSYPRLMKTSGFDKPRD